METILVDDEILSLEHFASECEGIAGVKLAGKFNFPTDALEFAQIHRVDLAVLDINMPEMDGLELGRRLQQINPDVILVYVTGYGEYAQEAMALRAATYIMKPYSREDIEFAFERARLLFKGKKADIFIKTFGRFDLFVNGRPVVFKNAKAKELLALCVEHQGGSVTMEEAIDKLWEDRLYTEQTKALYRKAVMALNNTLKENGCPEIFEKARGNCYIKSDQVRCDYFRLMDGDRELISDYMGEFMADYSWAEVNNGMIKKRIRKMEREIL